MLEQILDYIHNYFVKDVHSGIFKVSDRSLQVEFLQEGQYFKVVGSVFNDGIHKYPDDTLVDEVFTGTVIAMAVPPSVIALSLEIEDWMDKYGSVANSPYQSESFGGYSYTKGSISNGNGGSNMADWRSVFGSRLNHWRKIG